MIQSFGVPCELTIVSAHRTPDRMLNYARNAHKRGIKVIIAGAGGAAHLPGMVAALTPLPTVGVPVTPVGAHLDGLDALLSIVQVGFGSSVLVTWQCICITSQGKYNACICITSKVGVIVLMCYTCSSSTLSLADKQQLHSLIGFMKS